MSKKADGERMRSAWKFDFQIDETGDAGHRIADSLLEVFKHKRLLKSVRATQKLKEAIRVMVLNLYIAKAVAGAPVSISRSPKTYKKSRYHVGGHRIYQATMSAFEKAELLDMNIGFFRANIQRGYQTRIEAKSSLMTMCTEFGLSRFDIQRRAGPELIRLRGEKVGREPGPLIDYTDTPDTKRMRAEVEEINAQLADSFVGLYVTDGRLQYINDLVSDEGDEGQSRVDMARKSLYRVFNDGRLDRGGRFYGGWWQVVPSQFRKHIYIAQPGDASPLETIELDFTAVQPTLAYAKLGLEPDARLYHVPHWDEARNSRERKALKATLLRMLNTGSRAECIGVVERELKSGTYQSNASAEELVTELEGIHSEISAFFYSDSGKELMFYESQVAARVLIELALGGITVLPIHDSFIVQKRHEGLLRKSMSEAFEHVAGVVAGIEADQTELAEFKLEAKLDLAGAEMAVSELEQELAVVEAEMDDDLDGDVIDVRLRLSAAQARRANLLEADWPSANEANRREQAKLFWTQFEHWVEQRKRQVHGS